MTNKQLQEFLQEYPDDLPIKMVLDKDSGNEVADFDTERILLTSETAYVNNEAHEDEWDHEDGKIELGNGQRYLLFNPVIV